jgi:hypothetical protein
LPREEKVLQAALHYASMGQRVLPQIGKAPQVKEADASTDPATIKRWFGPIGAYRGQNVGLVLEGCRVLDLDRHDGKDGVKAIGVALDQIACPREVTPGNGYHLLVANTDLKGRPEKGIDIKTRITTWPSEVDGVPYKWETGGEPGRITGHLMMRLGGKNVKNAPIPSSFLSNTTPLVPSSYINHYLEHIDPDTDYDTWRSVGMAIHSEDDGPDYLAIWEEWSRGGMKFEEGVCAKKWATFNAEREKRITIRWLIRTAKKNGAPPHEHDDVYYDTAAQIIQEINEKYGIYNKGGKTWIASADRGEACFSAMYDLETLYANRPVMVGDKWTNPAKAWLSHPERRFIQHIGMWMPGREPLESLNLWTGFAIKPVECKEEEIKEFLDFCLEDICRGNREYAEYLWDLMARKIQKPLTLMGVALVLYGGEGTGKNLLTGVLGQIIGPNHYVAVSDRLWLDKYGGDHVANALFVEANEATWSGNHSESSRLKALMTEPRIGWEGKYKPKWTTPNNLFLAVTTNEDWAVPAGFDSRRFFVLKTSDKRKMDEAHWEKMAGLIGASRDDDKGPINPEYLGKVHYWLANREIKASFTRAMVTEWLIGQRKETAINSRDDLLVSWVRVTFCTDNAFGFNRPGGIAIPKVQVVDGEGQFIRTTSVSQDYRDYTEKHGRGKRSTYADEMLYEKLKTIGLVTRKMRKHRVIEQGKPLADDFTDSKISIMFVPPPEEIEANIATAFPLFAQGEEDDDDNGNS